MNSLAKKKKKHKKCKNCSSWVGHWMTSCPSCSHPCDHSSDSPSSGSDSPPSDSGSSDSGMSAAAWVRSNCKFAAPNIEGPISPNYYYYHSVKRPRDGYMPNPYGDYLPSGVSFNREYGLLTIETQTGPVELQLTPDQVNQFSAGFEKDIRKTFSEDEQQGQLAALVRDLMAGKGEENKDWSWSYDDNEGLAIYDYATKQDIMVLSNEELAKRGIPV